MAASSKRCLILGLPLDLLSPASARATLDRMLGEPWDGRCRQIVTLNPEYVIAATRDPSFADAIRCAELVTADGVGVVLAARLLCGKEGPPGPPIMGGDENFPRSESALRSAMRRPPPIIGGPGGASVSPNTLGRVTGNDLIVWLAEASVKFDAPLFLLGGREGIAARAAERLERQVPGCRIAGSWSEGSADPRDDAEALTRIASSGARCVAVAYGTPGQVLWIERNRARLAEIGVRVAIGVGGSLDFLAGEVPRAPRLVQRIGLEWLYRLVREPWRWRRQLVLPLFALRVIRQWLRTRREQRYPNDPG